MTLDVARRKEEQMRQLNNRQRARTFGYDSAPPQQPQQPAIRRTWAAGDDFHILLLRAVCHDRLPMARRDTGRCGLL